MRDGRAKGEESEGGSGSEGRKGSEGGKLERVRVRME